MADADLLARLAQHRTLGSAPPRELEWLADHGELRHFDRGEAAVRKGQPLDSLWILLSGHYVFYVDRGRGPRKVFEWRAGDVSGRLPYSRMTTPPGEAVIVEASDVLMIHSRHFPELVRECPDVTATLVHVMLDRARAFTSSALHDEKMVSMGRIAAGLAHELNNPASAAARSAKLLADAITEAELRSRSIASAHLTDAQFEVIDRVRSTCANASAALTPIERADREDELAAWLQAHGVDEDAAAALVDTGVTSQALDPLAASVQGPALDAALRWIAACCTIRMLAADVEKASSRMHDLVGAVKRFTYMDRQQAPEAVDIAPGVRDSVALLAHKARRKSVAITVMLDSGLPPVRAIGSDLNQVWTNLLDNAIDAVPDSGRVEISADVNPGFVVVRIVDDGPGIPPEIRDRIFDPFFTTKPVGEGTGLGLEIARRLVQRNGGDLELESRPGHTEFRVAVPVADGAAPEAQ